MAKVAVQGLLRLFAASMRRVIWVGRILACHVHL